MTFKQLGIIDPILKALENKGYTHPTPIQAQSIPILLDHKDLLGCAQTGTGKTAAFTIPIIQNMYLDYGDQQRGRHYKPRIKALIVTPTRELAIQISDNIKAYGEYTNLRSTVVFGGVKQGKQVQVLNRGVDILVATPGRLLDYIGQGIVSLKAIEYFVLDEADQMLDMGFINDIKRILKHLPDRRQSLFFSATMPKSIIELSSKILGRYEQVTIKPEQATAEKVEQAIYYIGKKQKIKLLIHLLKEKMDPNPEEYSTAENATLVFSRTKHGADRIVRKLNKANINAAAIHGNKSQGARQRALGAFKTGELTVLVATDIAARGIDVSGLALVINYDLPNVPETYVHRIGRTGRANASGVAWSFCDVEERDYLRDIQKLIGQRIPVIDEHPFEAMDEGQDPNRTSPPPKQQRGRGQARRNPNRNNRPKRGGSSNRSNNSSSGDRRESGNRDGGNNSGGTRRSTGKGANSGNGSKKKSWYGRRK